MTRKITIGVMVCIVLFSLQGCKPRGFDADFKAAEAAVGIGDNDGALNAYRAVVDRYPADPRRCGVLLKIADIYDTSLHDDISAARAYARVIKEYPLSDVSVPARERHALLMEKKGDFDGEIEDYSDLLKHFPESPDRYRYRVLMAGAYLSQRNFGQARMEIKPLLDDRQIPPEVREQALFVAGESFFLEDHPEKAAPYYQQMLREFPNSKLASEAELHFATCAEEMGYLGTARDITRDAARDYPNKKVIDAKLKSIKERATKHAEPAPPAGQKKP
ncbi:MAG: tetratricopeptide repeat protein [Pseudomonadota bacterium]